jgi:hypothetical protein
MANGRWWLLRVVAVCSLFGSEAIHTSIIAAHLAEWVGAGAFFTVISVIEGLLAVGLIETRSRWACLVGLAVSMGTVGVWAVSRTVGIPFGPNGGRVEAIGAADAVSTVLELTAACALATLALAEPASKVGTRRPRPVVVAAMAVIVVVGLLTALAVAAPA